MTMKPRRRNHGNLTIKKWDSCGDHIDWLVVYLHPRKRMSSSVGKRLFPIYGKICSKPPISLIYLADISWVGL
jgi:hypothetical protein